MSNRTLLSTLLGAAVACLPAYSKKPATAVPNDAAFLSMAAQADMTTAHIGQEAEDRAAEGKVKDFAKTLAQDHTSDYQSLTELAGKLGETIPKAIDSRNDRAIAALDHYKGKTYDHMFLTHESTEHEKLVSAFRLEAEKGQNPAIKAYASKALPVIERHLHDAQDLLKQHA
jgi:putative membrane protein